MVGNKLYICFTSVITLHDRRHAYMGMFEKKKSIYNLLLLTQTKEQRHWVICAYEHVYVIVYALALFWVGYCEYLQDFFFATHREESCVCVCDFSSPDAYSNFTKRKSKHSVFDVVLFSVN